MGEERFTKVENELLENLARSMASGLITAKERAILDLVIRYTYGYHSENGYFKSSQIAESLGMRKDYTSFLISRLVKKGILIKKEGKLGLNLNFKEWRFLDSSKKPLDYSKNLDCSKKTEGKILDYSKTFLDQSKTLLDYSKNQTLLVPFVIPFVNPPKEIYIKKYTKERLISKDIKEQIKKCSSLNKYEKDVYEFWLLLSGKPFSKDDIPKVKKILALAPPTAAKNIITSYFPKIPKGKVDLDYFIPLFEKLKLRKTTPRKKKISFKEFIELNPQLDYTRFEQGSREREVALWRALKQAYRSGNVEFTDQMMRVYTKFLDKFENKRR